MNRTIGMCLVSAGLSILSLAALHGCNSVPTRGVAIEGAGAGVPGPLAIDIQNQLGEVEVVVDPSVPAPTVEVVPFSAQRPIGQIDRMSALRPWTAAQIAEDEGGHRVLRVLCTAAENQPVSPVYLLVRTPGCDGVRVRNTGGPVTLTGVGGAIEVTCTPSTPLIWEDGASVRIRTDRPITSAITVSSTDGAVTVSVPRTSTGSIEAISPDTVVSLAGVAGDQKIGPTRTNVRGAVTASLNGGENPISIKSGKRIRFIANDQPQPAPVVHVASETKPETAPN